MHFRKWIYLPAAVLFVALSARFSLELPMNAQRIPITGQSLAVLIVGYALGSRWGTAAIAVYVLLGALGLPVFADGRSGWSVLQGGSGGFLLGFIFAAALMGYLGEEGWGRSFTKSLLAMFFGTVLILFFGLVRLTMLYDWPSALAYGFYPFLPGAVIKIILGALIMPLYYRLRSTSGQ